MAITVVQKSPNSTVLAEQPDGSSVSTTFSSSTTSGNRLVLYFSIYEPTVPSCTISDTEGLTWTRVVDFVSAANDTRLIIAYTNAIAGTGSHQVSVSTGGPFAYMTLGVFELSGVHATTPVGTPATSESSGTSVSVGAVSGGSWYLAGMTSAANPGGITNTWTSSTTQYAPGAPLYDAVASKFSASSETVTWTLGNSVGWYGAIAPFIAVSSGGRNPVSMGFDLR